MKTHDSYLQVDPYFYDILNIFMGKNIKVIYWGCDNTLEESKGMLKGILQNEKGEFLNIEDARNVRLDLIITVEGKPGPAFSEYEAFANACLSCQAGYDD
ncbi:MAG: hypothetical protein PQJ28_01685 [Spirochaetales bacterium]|nr:hypothetical protein [Spirochaetales bacterium]